MLDLDGNWLMLFGGSSKLERLFNPRDQSACIQNQLVMSPDCATSERVGSILTVCVLEHPEPPEDGL